MPQFDLTGKTVMIATTDEMWSLSIKKQLKELGATVLFSKCRPHDRSSIRAISDEVEKHEPKIDAFIIHNSNNEWEDGPTTVLELTARLNEARPVIVCDSCPDQAYIKRFRDMGAKYFNYWDTVPRRIAGEVADAVTDRNKSGKVV